MKRILVATDGSEGAGRAVEYASRRAKDDGAELWIVNVMGGHGLPEQWSAPSPAHSTPGSTNCSNRSRPRR